MNFLVKIKQHISSFFEEKTKKYPVDLVDKNSIKKIENVLEDITIYKTSNRCIVDCDSIEKKEFYPILKELLTNTQKPQKTSELLNIYGDCLELHKTLLPLFDLHIGYTMDLVGGAVREYLLDKTEQIKDLDVIIHMYNSYNYQDHYFRFLFHEKLLVKEKLIDLSWCTKEELERVNFSDEEEIQTRYSKLLELCLYRNHTLLSKRSFSKSERKIGEGLYNSEILTPLDSLIKINAGNLNYPMEVLIVNSKEDFLNKIDFGICNVSLRVFDYNLDNSLTKVENLYKSFVFSKEFLNDVQNKTITYNKYNISPQQIEYSFTNHLERVFMKYPDYNKVVPEDMDIAAKQYINAFNLTKKLQSEMLNVEKTQSKRKKI